MTALARVDVDRLAKTLALMSSPYDAEALAAARAAERLRVRIGRPWADLLTAEGIPPDAPAWRSMAAECTARSGYWTAWEADFLATIAAYDRPPSPRQMWVLERLVARCRV
jgi:hypothetical protein